MEKDGRLKELSTSEAFDATEFQKYLENRVAIIRRSTAAAGADDDGDDGGNDYLIMMMMGAGDLN